MVFLGVKGFKGIVGEISITVTCHMLRFTAKMPGHGRTRAHIVVMQLSQSIKL